ncbi:chromosome condensation regulator RCC1 repeat protein [Gregarina niphandrodes]|uniref:Chromosome condensation regulator RCC1 repeat protein n=1 Tax=Gregarina niphandrodes TaxID=110365 RepID=A0A023B5F4_GRENI|nr:chromosome condensation regulator RCC1 repeat protein [Gregarina niphandrodes]EZG60072.1 chromosome condensation regulator RCC1 repeat protein [Gregarina niphandrodes]|eukprot:XP_011130856.1 chromosome condensation regulator RCC1 repeat protein [Gregarina niphandrodes]
MAPTTRGLTEASRPVCRIWGRRPFQPFQDNSQDAQKYWNEIAEVKYKVRQKQGSAAEVRPVESVLTELKQLSPGPGPGVPKHLPISYDGIGRRIVKISCGSTFIAFLTEANEVYTVGHGLQGQLGQGPKVGALRTPAKVAMPKPETASAAVRRAGSGESVQNMTASRNWADSLSEPAGEEAAVVVDVAAGEAHCLALAEDGVVFVWGASQACGLATVDDVLTPAVLNDAIPLDRPAQETPPTTLGATPGLPPAQKVVAVAACAQKSIALSLDGRLYLWGNWPGRARIIQPLEVAQVLSEEGAVHSAKIVLGETAGVLMLKLTETPHRVYLYQFGMGIRNEILSPGRQFDEPLFQRKCESRYDMFVPEPISTYLNKISGLDCYDVLDVAVGSRHMLVLTSEGKILCWGDNSWGQCGVTGERMTRVSPPACVSFQEEVTPVRVFAGGNQSAFISDVGQVYMWGCNQDHRLANSAIKLLAEAPIRALGPKGFVASLGRASSIGTSTAASVQDSLFSPQRVLALGSYHATAIGMGEEFTAIATD